MEIKSLGKFHIDKKLIDDFNNVLSIKMLFNTSTLKYFIKNNVKGPKIPIIEKKLSNEALEEAIKKFENITNKNLTTD